MDKRLICIASHISHGVGFADVGTDHGLIPAELAKRGYAGNIIASDINPLPLEAARATARAAGVEDRISFLLCDGLSLCDRDSIDTIVIAGMGGDMICRILDEAEWCMDERYALVLQPMTRPEVLRYWLVNNGFEIVCEDAAEDAGKAYQVIVSRFGGCTDLTDGELYIGRLALAADRELYMRLLKREIKSFEAALKGMSVGALAQDGRRELYESVLSELYLIRRAYDDGQGHI